jgi:hypothetical protein
MSDSMKQYNAARRVSVPLVVWKTPDPAATMSSVVGVAKYPVFSWDVVRGIMPANDLARGKCEAGSLLNPVEMLEWSATKLPADAVVFMHNAHLHIGANDRPNEQVIQGIWNLRDSNKAEHRMLVMLSPQMRTPLELSNDVMVIDEALPNDKELTAIVAAQVGHAKVGSKDSGVKFNEPSEADVVKAVDALSGLSAYAAEQSVAVSFEKNGNGVGLNLGTLWERKKQVIEETRGLKVWRDGETLDDVKGCENIKKFARRIIGGRMPPRVIVFIDEIEKSGVANTGDTSGTNMDQLGALLTKMQDSKAQGILCVGHAGSAKSMFSKAFGNTAGIVTIQMDLGAMKGSLVGESEKNIRAALKVVDAVGQDRVLYIATCNDIKGLPAALRRRFTLGTFFFDLPTLEEREAIWEYYVKKFGLKGKGFTQKGSGGYKVEGVDDEGWTGADIYNCANRAWMFDSTLAEAAKYATPVSRTDPAGIEALRNLADGAFISANYEGIYKKDRGDTVKIKTDRKMKFE